MTIAFTPPAGMLGKFGVIKLWPELQVAEDEVIARVINSAKVLGLECVVLDQLGCSIKDGGRQMKSGDLDFVIHLHFSTPKLYDIFSFVTLWNPPEFFAPWGHRAMLENLRTHDDFLSCGSPGADGHINQLIRRDNTHLSPKFNLYHSLATPILPPTLGELTIFYMGINWEASGKQKSRHGDVLQLLDESGKLKIFGPRELHGVKVWDGFKSYQRPLPFDGVSVIEELHIAGVCLVLSSQAHKNVGMMSNRLFEGLAAGALIICDENTWAAERFGDALLYVDMREDTQTVVKSILAHLEWAENNRAEALALAARAQAIFKERYMMDASIKEIYNGLPARQTELNVLNQRDVSGTSVRVYFLAPVMDETFERQIDAALAHTKMGFKCKVLVDQEKLHLAEARYTRNSDYPFELCGVAFHEKNPITKLRERKPLGKILAAEMKNCVPGDLVCFINNNEIILSTHIYSLARELLNDQSIDHSFSKMIKLARNADGTFGSTIDVNLHPVSIVPSSPIGLGRFMFRADAYIGELDFILPNLDSMAASGLALHTAGSHIGSAAIILDERDAAPIDDEAIEQYHTELSRVREINPERFDVMYPPDRLETDSSTADALLKRLGFEVNGLIDTRISEDLRIAPTALYLDNMTPENRRALMLSLLKSIFPRFVWRFMRLFSRR